MSDEKPKPKARAGANPVFEILAETREIAAQKARQAEAERAELHKRSPIRPATSPPRASKGSRR